MSSRALGETRSRLGKYEMGKTLGEGAFAKVKFALNIETGDHVAIKVFDKHQILRHRMVEQVITTILILLYSTLSYSNRI